MRRVREPRYLYGIVTMVVIGTIAVYAWPNLVNAIEYARYRMDPSAERAFEYGSRHLDASEPEHYNLERAEFYYREASRNPNLPYVYHELARISFLKGEFNAALAQINLQISLHGSTTRNSFYVRGLINGFVGDYDAAARDYETYLRTDSKNWAAINDYAWVLLKAKRYEDALIAVDWGLIYWPDNAWLHNSRATALFELGRIEAALKAAEAASAAAALVTETQWSQAYPGNDPLIAGDGVRALQVATSENMHTIQLAFEEAQKGMR